ncbi:DUF2085 domain-containing protein [Peribacillus sp. SCS-155]|uniref:DUF2085 domain-containing protein n=1 Tax=Peribacillus sedimenti TaxID=3115297 RepID=UPI0039059C0A
MWKTRMFRTGLWRSRMWRCRLQLQFLNKLFLIVPCHRRPERCFHIKGKPMPICSRCLCILAGYMMIPFLFLFKVGIIWGLLCQIPMLIDGLTQLKGWRQSNNLLRAATGLISGSGLSIGIVSSVRVLIEVLKQ